MFALLYQPFVPYLLFIRNQTLTLLEKLNELDADEQADICESLHDHADELYRSCLARFGDDGENL
ncbi:Rop family plasmid primer RNA-binding protein [Escherichia coli]|nr:Rop family plasmid primer RNA-binding protein [Escherichia coli]EKC9890423.1 Rop family plasmid primer RNA-binding protein [Escherichia coli]EKH7503248.1 Rop family plasmid primer RNA-binding protein [Escherichia coli]EKH7538745.1 Rop family plasmid primer RNA-binding protein [Escherichia coli]